MTVLCPFSAIGRFRPRLFHSAWCAGPRPRSGEDRPLDGATPPPPQCALWNRRDVKCFQPEMSTPSPQADTPVTPEYVHTVYQSLAQRMLEAMRVVNDSRAPTREPDPPVTDWASVVKQPAKQAKRRSKLFYRRVKHSLLSPPAESTLPVPTRKIQRILQRNTPWSEDATSLIRRVERLHDPPPPLYPSSAP